MKKQTPVTGRDASSSGNLRDIPEENYVFVKYSDFMDFLQSVKDASTALSHLVTASADIKLMSMRPTAREGLSQKLTGISDIKQSMQLLNKLSEADGSKRRTGKTSKSTDSHSADSRNGQTKKSLKK